MRCGRKPGLVVLMVFLGGFSSMSAYSDWDAPSNPPLKHTIFVDQVVFTDVPDDGANGKSELFIHITVAGLGLVEVSKSETLDLEETGGIWHLGLKKVVGYECSPPRALFLTYTVIELDNGGGEIVKSMLFAGARAAALWYLLNPTVGASHLATGLMGSAMLPILNGHDDYGYGTVVIDPSEDEDGESIWPEYFETTPKTVQMKTLFDKDSGAILRVHLTITEEEDREECEVPQAKQVDGQKLLKELYETVTKWFEKLLAKPEDDGGPYSGSYGNTVANKQINALANEQKAANFDRYQVDRLKKTYTSIVLGKGTAAVFSFFKYAQLKGVPATTLSQAWAELEKAEVQAQRAVSTQNRDTRANYIKRALKAQWRALSTLARVILQNTPESAGLAPTRGPEIAARANAADARRKGILPASFATLGSPESRTVFEPPLHLFLWFDYLAIKPGNDVTLLAALSRDVKDLRLRVTGLPEEAAAKVEPMEGVPAHFWITIETSALPPGIYPFTVSAEVGGKTVSHEAVVAVEGS